MIPAEAVVEKHARRFSKSFPIKMDGTPASVAWQRGDRPLLNPHEPAKGSRGSRRNDGGNWLMMAFHYAVGDEVAIHTVVRGQHRVYRIDRPARIDALAYLYYATYLAQLGRASSHPWLAAALRVLDLTVRQEAGERSEI